MYGVMVEGLVLGVEIKKQEQGYTCGLAQLGYIDNDKFINVDDNKIYNIYKKNSNNDDNTILIIQPNVKNFLKFYMNVNEEILSSSWIKYLLKDVYPNINFFPPKKKVIKGGK